MKFTQSIFLTFWFFVFALGMSASDALENVNRAFLYGEVGSSTGFEKCPGTCSSSNPGRAVGIGYLFEFMPVFDSEPQVASINLEYWRAQYVINGNALDVTRKEINLGWDINFDEQRRYVLSIGPGIGWVTVNGPGSLSHTSFNPSGMGKFIYQVSPSLALTLNYYRDYIFSANQPDFTANSVGIGLRWYL